MIQVSYEQRKVTWGLPRKRKMILLKQLLIVVVTATAIETKTNDI